MNYKNAKLFLTPAIFFTVFFVFFAKAEAADYYVSPTGNDSNSGSIDAPFRTIQKAANIVNPGDTVIVKDGTYSDSSDNFIIELKRSGNASDWITFQAENQYGAVLDGQNSTTGACIISTSSVHHIIIDGFEIKGCREGIYDNEGAHDIKVLNNDIHHIGNYCGSSTSANDAWGIHMGVPVYPNYNWTISGNKIHDIGRPTYCQGTGYSSRGDYPIYLNGHDMTVTNNLIYDNYAGWDIHIGRSCVSGDDGKNFLISNNTIYGYDTHSSDVIFFLRDGCSGQFSNVRIQNNIVYNPNSGVFVKTLGGLVSGINIMNNLVYGPSYGDTLRLSTDSSYVPGTETGNIIGQDPKFVDVTNKDFHLKPDSPAINAGLDASSYMTRDMDGNARPQGIAYDIGAYEYVGTKVADTTPPASPNGLSVH